MHNLVVKIPHSWKFLEFEHFFENVMECAGILWKYSQKRFLFIPDGIVFLLYLNKSKKFLCLICQVIPHVIIRDLSWKIRDNLRKSWTELKWLGAILEKYCSFLQLSINN